MICLKTRTFAVSQTTDVRPFVFSAVLWFAWKLVHLQYRKQLFRWSCNAVSCCDLLENSYICSIANNLVLALILLKLLWFAWKLVLLQYRKQPSTNCMVLLTCCDLLENSYFCSIANNSSSVSLPLKTVVICLKTRTFAVSQTTVRLYLLIPQQLWFAWKLVLLQYRKQHSIALSRLLICCDLLENSYFCSIANNI